MINKFTWFIIAGLVIVGIFEMFDPGKVSSAVVGLTHLVMANLVFMAYLADKRADIWRQLYMEERYKVLIRAAVEKAKQPRVK